MLVHVRNITRPLGEAASRPRLWDRGRPTPAPPPRRLRKLPAASALLAVGGAAAYLLDPQQGRGRRARMRDQARAAARRRRLEAERSVRYAQGRLEGTAAAVRGKRRFTPADDRALADKLKEVLSRTSSDTSDVTVEVVDGVATLRGELGTPQEVQEITRACAEVNGIERVENLLHLPGTEAPNKAASRRVGRSGPRSGADTSSPR